MGQETANYLSALLFDVYRACHGIPVRELRRSILDRVRKDIPFDGAVWVSAVFDGAHGPQVNDCLLLDRPQEQLDDYERIKHHDPLVKINMRNPGRAFYDNYLSEQTGVSKELRAHASRFRLEHALAIHIKHPLTGLSNGIALWRAPGDPPYQEADRVLLELAAPHLIESYGAGWLTHLENVSRPGSRANVSSGVSDKTGLLHLARHDLTDLLLVEFPRWKGPLLPEAARSIVASRQGGRFVGEKIALTATLVDEVYLLRGWAKRAADLLTSRELEIARLCLKGLTYKEIAKASTIAPGTVRNHISSILSKLKVRKQSEIGPALSGTDA